LILCEDRSGGRDAALILIAYRHGLRVGELVALRWDQVDLRAGLLHVSRLKGGVPSTHPLRGPELRALRRLRRRYSGSAAYVFTTKRGGPPTDSGVRKIVARAGAPASLPFPVHPHVLRHATGYKLANDGQDTRAIQHYLGHKNIVHTTRYTNPRPIGSGCSGGTEPRLDGYCPRANRRCGLGAGNRGAIRDLVRVAAAPAEPRATAADARGSRPRSASAVC
jgi:integrase